MIWALGLVIAAAVVRWLADRAAAWYADFVANSDPGSDEQEGP